MTEGSLAASGHTGLSVVPSLLTLLKLPQAAKRQCRDNWQND